MGSSRGRRGVSGWKRKVWVMVVGQVFVLVLKYWRVRGSGNFGNCPDVNLRVVLRRCPGTFNE